MRKIHKKDLKKWIIISSSISQGGAAIASKRLANLISKDNRFKVIFIYTNKINSDNIRNLNKNIEVKYFPQSLFKKKLGSLLTNCLSRILGQTVSLLIFSNKSLLNYLNKQDNAIVNLHWINNQSISFNDIKKIKHKIIWTCHDIWPINQSGFHYLPNKNLNFFKKIISQLVKKISRIQSRNIDYKKIIFVTPSKWLSTFASNKVKCNSRILKIPNPLDENLFVQRESKYKALINKFEKDYKLVFFPNPIYKNIKYRKGTDLIPEIIDELAKFKSKIIIFYIDSSLKKTIRIEYKNLIIYKLAYIEEIRDMSFIIKRTNVTAITSRVENLPQVVVESQALGKPVVTFDTSGIIEAYNPKNSGISIVPYNCKEFAKAIIKIIRNPKKEKVMSNKAIDFYKNNFNLEQIRIRYLNIFK